MYRNRTRRRCDPCCWFTFSCGINETGLSPEAACKKIVERIVKIKGNKVKEIQVAFLAVNKKGQVGSFAIHPGFEYAIRTNELEKLVKSKSWFNPTKK